MLEPAERQQLRRIEQTVTSDDPRFAAGMARGEPWPPREYRRRQDLGLAVGLIAAPLVAAVGTMWSIRMAALGAILPVLAVLVLLLRAPSDR
ncbi:DUF3040 domain-containing protein [Rugosimonospora africana]|uniref:DUF3040 domain-containing protein n=1 Tax=Rugosimonospora africana TaxID=556532 RepID=A0A8J3R7I5_9ACTN|nr:DUF3040 domain-containing protein [Rugosimonospora africana]GIH21456.1 hypothetical protein Raf01_96280 [Rugosimonospora africana]